jgi:hypothetical protein
VPRRDVTEANIVGQGAEERDSVSDKHGHTGDDETLNQSGAQELLNGDSTVDVEMVGAAGSEFRNYLGWRSGHLLNHASDNR